MVLYLIHDAVWVRLALLLRNGDVPDAAVDSTDRPNRQAPQPREVAHRPFQLHAVAPELEFAVLECEPDALLRVEVTWRTTEPSRLAKRQDICPACGERRGDKHGSGQPRQRAVTTS